MPRSGRGETAVLPSRLASKMPELPDHPPAEAPEPACSYDEFLEDIKGRIRSAQARAARTINAELIDVLDGLLADLAA
jgi:hypothetical protein